MIKYGNIRWLLWILLTIIEWNTSLISAVVTSISTHGPMMMEAICITISGELIKSNHTLLDTKLKYVMYTNSNTARMLPSSNLKNLGRNSESVVFDSRRQINTHFLEILKIFEKSVTFVVRSLYVSTKVLKATGHYKFVGYSILCAIMISREGHEAT